MSDYLDKYPASDRIGNLFAGSWINHNFGIWLGHPECNRAWDLVSQTREYLVSMAGSGQKSPEQLTLAWEELFIAEGSDWFWWFGDSHSSAQDSLFDDLFRKHLQNVYTVLGEQPPAELLHAIRLAQRHLRQHTEPTGLLNIKVNGRQTYFEWINAGHYEATGGRGTMSMADRRRVRDLYFGFDDQRLLVRLDFNGGSAREQLAEVDALRLSFLEPAGFELSISDPGSPEPPGARLYPRQRAGQSSRRGNGRRHDRRNRDSLAEPGTGHRSRRAVLRRARLPRPVPGTNAARSRDRNRGPSSPDFQSDDVAEACEQARIDECIMHEFLDP